MILPMQGPVPPYMPPEIGEVIREFFTMITVIALGIPIIRAFTRRMDRGPATPTLPSPDVVARLERIEQAVEAIAVEVERVAEAQRFSAKLQAEQSKRVLSGES